MVCLTDNHSFELWRACVAEVSIEAQRVARYHCRMTGTAVPPSPAEIARQNKFKRYRASQRDKGMKLLRVWVPDPQAPGFRHEADRQAALLKGAAEEWEALDFIEAAAQWDSEGA
jgi:hypothetical protein